jgi:hypothetical protein
MVAKQMDPDVEARRDQKGRQRRANRNRKVSALAVAAAICLVAVACTPEARRGQDATTPTSEPPTAAPATSSEPFFLDLQTLEDDPAIHAGETTPLAANLAGGFNYVASPDGTRLVYGTCCSGADVMTVANIDGTDERVLDAPEGLNYYGARWSPDGTKLVYQARDGGGDDALTGDVGNLFVHDLSTGRRTQITDLELSRASWWFLSPSFSPNGRNVIFHLPRSRSRTTKWDAWSVPVTGGEPTLLLRNALFPVLGVEMPTVEPIAFVSPSPADLAGSSIITARLLPPPDISDLHQTLVEANDLISWPVLSPDGGMIAYWDGGSIYVVDLFTRESSEVAEGGIAEWLDSDTLIVAP